jgi:hypothetical protein
MDARDAPEHDDGWKAELVTIHRPGLMRPGFSYALLL